MATYRFSVCAALGLSLLASFARAESDVKLSPEDVEFFEKKIRPVLVARCYKCHSAESGKSKGGLLVDSREGLLRGGQTGPAVVPGDPEKSLLIRAIRFKDEELEMPPKDQLTPEQIADFEKWIKNGASDPRKKATAAGVALAPAIDFDKARQFWSFQPVKDPPVPAVKNKNWPKCAIDSFVLAKLEEKGLTPSAPVDKRALIRRATFDLIGLPPQPEEIDAFLADNSPNAFEKVIDRLLASPHYGERWGRHWLDIARYADTAGESADYPIPQAYRYRNYVIDAFNQDKPYDRFIKEQIAGDLLGYKNDDERFELLTATGFIACARRFGTGPETTHHLTIEDTIDTMGRSLLGLTLSCSRCHDHKFDPIPTKDYYALYGIFASSRYPFPGSEETKHQYNFVPLASREQYDKLVKPYEDKLAAMRAEHEKLIKEGKTIEVEPEAAERPTTPPTLALPKDGPQPPSVALLDADTTKAFTLNAQAGQARSEIVAVSDQSFKSAIRVTTVAQPVNRWEIQLHAENIAPIEKNDVLLVSFWMHPVEAKGQSGAASAEVIIENNGAPYNGILQHRVNATPGPWRHFEVPVVSNQAWAPGKASINIRLGYDAQTVEIGGVEIKNYKQAVKVVEAPAPQTKPKKERLASINQQIENKKKQIDQYLSSSPDIPKAYAIIDDVPRDVAVHVRGEPSHPGDEVRRGFLQILGGQKLPESEKGSGRLELAEWLTDTKNPLTARVMVNRIWQHHFGKPIVQTPSDFGKQGRAPTHPELLDHLATRFMQSGWSIKAMHKMLMLSQTYQLSSTDTAVSAKAADGRPATEADPTNDYLRIINRQRLDAEAVRDSLLFVSGMLDNTIGGEHPFPPANKWNYTQHDQFFALYETNRRSVYVMQQRLRKHPFFATFDGSDPSTTTGTRLLSTTPLQALFMMNDKFTHEQAEKFAGRILNGVDAGLENDAKRVELAYRIALGRKPSDDEVKQVLGFLDKTRDRLKAAAIPPSLRQQQAWSGFARALLSSNEFIYID